MLYTLSTVNLTMVFGKIAIKLIYDGIDSYGCPEHSLQVPRESRMNYARSTCAKSCSMASSKAKLIRF